MRVVIALFLTLLAGATALADAKFYAEAGASHFALRGARFEKQPNPLTVSDDKGQIAPFVAAGYSFTDTLGLRLSYHFVDDVSGSALYPYPPDYGDIRPLVAVVTWGFYRDDIHLLSLAPELKWPVNGKLKLSFSPSLNWVASRGEVTYSFTSLSTLIPALARKRRDDGFTFGGSVGLTWSVAERVALSAGYHYVDLDPSFNRTAHIISGGLRWEF
jgi:hypothetical protein